MYFVPLLSAALAAAGFGEPGTGRIGRLSCSLPGGPATARLVHPCTVGGHEATYKGAAEGQKRY